MAPKARPLIDRFMEKVSPCPVTGCWWWTASANRWGYGKLDRGTAHRAAWTLFVGPIKPGMNVCHKCDRPTCVNPEHLFIGTTQDNTADRTAKGRSAAGDRNGARLRPERLNPPRGDNHYSRRAPWMMARGPRPSVQGENNVNAKLSAADVADIRRSAASGIAQARLVAKYGVSKQLISAIVNRRCWVHTA